MGLIKKILKIAVASKMADDYVVFPAAMYLANSKPDIEDEICEISLTEDVSQFEIEKNKLCNYLYDFKREDLKKYIVFKKALIAFKKFYGIDEYNLKDIDRYLFQLGKDYFPNKY